jgi:hypothetical protein
VNVNVETKCPERKEQDPVKWKKRIRPGREVSDPVARFLALKKLQNFQTKKKLSQQV